MTMFLWGLIVAFIPISFFECHIRVICPQPLEMAPSIKAYIVHASFMDIRKQHLNTLVEIFKKNSIDYEYVEGYEPGSITPVDIQTLVNLSKANNGEFYDNLVRNMHINQISNAMKHGMAIKKAAASGSAYDYYLVIEDDVLYGDDVIQKLNATVAAMEADKDVDLLFLGFPSLAPIEDKDKIVLKATSEFYKMFPCCDSYLIRAADAQKIADVYFPIKFITNFQLAYVADTNKFKTSMAVPNVFLDGSKYGAYLSAIDPNNKLLFNPEFIQLANLLQSQKPGAEDEKAIAAAFENIKFKNHPDVMHMQAIYAISKGEYAKAEKLLESIFEISTQNGCIVNNETEFLRTYMRLYKFIQE